jgi:hypothetical protein
MKTYPATLANPIEVPIPADDGRSTPKTRYGPLMEAAGQWIAITDLDLIRGGTAQKKQVALHNAAKQRGMRIKTTSQHGFIYAKLAIKGVA